MKHLITILILAFTLTVNAQTHSISYTTENGVELTSRTGVDILFTQDNPIFSNLKVIQGDSIIFNINLELVKTEKDRFSFYPRNQFVLVELNPLTDSWILMNNNIWIEIQPYSL